MPDRDGDGEEDLDGFCDGDLDGLGDGDFDGWMNDGDDWTGGGVTVRGRLTFGDGFLAAEEAETVAGAVAVVATADGLVDGGLALDRAARAWAGREPTKVSRVTLTAATTHTTMTTVAVAAPGLARILAHLTGVIAWETLESHADSARRVARRQYATASGVVAEESLRTCSRNSGGSGAGGRRLESAAGRSVP